MYKITDVAAVSGRYIIELSDGDASEKYHVAKEFLPNFEIEPGSVLCNDDIEELMSASLKTEALGKALDALSYSNMSRRALVDKLRLKYKIDRDVAEEVTKYVAARKYLDEDAQAEKIARAAVRTKMWGRKRVVMELIAKGYPKEVAVRAASMIPEEEYSDALVRLVGKKLHGAPADNAALQKAVSSLARCGHAPQDVKREILKLYGTEE